jgi:hypothetical protein
MADDSFIPDGTTGRLAAYLGVPAAAAGLIRYKLNRDPGFAQKLYASIKKAEELSPFHVARTFSAHQFASAFLPQKFHIPENLIHQAGEQTPLGLHLERLIDEVKGRGTFARMEWSGGLSLERLKRGSPFMRIQGTDIDLMMAERGWITGSSARYHAGLGEFRSVPGSPLRGNRWEQLKTWRKNRQLAVTPRTYREMVGHLVEGEELGFQPLLAWSKTNRLKSVYRGADRTLFQLTERFNKSLLGPIGIGLDVGTYNKLWHVPFVGKGGIVNRLLTHRVLPAVAAATALRYADYLLGHPSDQVAALPFRANVLRAELTEGTPFGRDVTDWYAKTVPGPQYGPLALPLGGMFAGGLLHYADVLRGKFSGTGKTGEALRKIESGVVPNLERLRALGKAEGIEGIWKNLLHAKGERALFGKPAKGGLIGLALMLPFLPGMLGSREQPEELRRIYAGEQDVPVRSGRWWEIGSSAWEGGRIVEWRKHWLAMRKAHAEEASLYGSEKEYWAHNPLLHPIRYLRDPEWLEREHYQDRPYPITSPAFSNVPFVGPLLAGTIGKLVKPARLMHQGEWSPENYTLYSTRLEPRGDAGLPPPEAQPEFTPWSIAKLQARNFSEMIGLPGFMGYSFYKKLFPGQPGQTVELEGSRQMTNFSRRYYERELGGLIGPSPEGMGTFGYSEPFRRFVQREQTGQQVNEIPNAFADLDYMPGDDYFVNLKVGDPYAALPHGYARLPGAGYAALHPEVEGLSPEEYPDIVRLEILADVAPYSREFSVYRAKVGRQIGGNAELKLRFEQALERARQTKQSTVHAEERKFTRDAMEISGRVKSASLAGFELEEYPGRTFTYSSIGTSMADISAVMMGERNASTRAQVATEAAQRQMRAADYIARQLRPGASVRATIPKGALETTPEIQAVVEAGGDVVNQALVSDGLARFRKDLSGPEAQALYGPIGRTFGGIAEELSFTGDNGLTSFFPTPYHTKLWQMRSALAQYEAQESIETRMRRWDRPFHDFAANYARGTVKRLTGESVVSPDVRHRRNLDTLADVMNYLRGQRALGRGEDPARYTSQVQRSAVGSNLLSAPEFLASTLPAHESRYFSRFLAEVDPARRAEILEVVSPEMARALSTQWVARESTIAAAEGRISGPIGENGRLYTEEDQAEYRSSGSKLDYGDWMRSKEISEFFASSGYRMPEQDSEAWAGNIDYEDIKLKILQQEGYDYHDFNYFDDRAALLWRKPYLDGAVRELTSGSSGDAESIRRSVEQMILSARNSNPGVVAISHPSPKASANVNVTVDIDDQKPMLRDIRRNPEHYDN